MMQFPISELLDEQKCYQYLWHTLPPNGLSCPAGHPLPNGPPASATVYTDEATAYQALGVSQSQRIGT